MTANDFIALLPILVLTIGATLLMLQISFYRNTTTSVIVTLLTLVGSILAIIPATEHVGAVTPLLQVDGYALLFTALFCLGAIITSILCGDYLQTRADETEEFYLLLLLANLGAVVLAHATHLASLLLGMELLGVSLYALIGYPDRAVLPLEAAVKYLVLSGAATATILFGFALLYAVTGELTFTGIGQQLISSGQANVMQVAGSAMIMAGLAFKLSLAPFHMWTPDVYEGAPSPVTGYLAAISKTAIFAALLRLFLDAQLFRFELLNNGIATMAVLSMIGGNLLALQQDNIKRMLAYSSIAHMGYLAIILVAAGQDLDRPLAIEAALYYLIAYTATTVAAFALLTLLSTNSEGLEKSRLDDLSGLFWEQPLLAVMMTLALLSLAGIPLTAGFIAKFYVISTAVSGFHWVLLAALVVGSGMGIYYYLRAIYYMTCKNDDRKTPREMARPLPVRAVSCVLIAGILILGIVPQPLIEHIRFIFG